MRTSFVIAEEGRTRPPLAELLSNTTGNGGGGRGGQIRLKLYLSLLWVCAKAPYEATRPARAWAALLGLDDVDGRGARRIHSAFRDLEDRDMVRIRDRGGQATGRTACNRIVHFPAGEDPPAGGSYISIRIARGLPNCLVGERVA